MNLLFCERTGKTLVWWGRIPSPSHAYYIDFGRHIGKREGQIEQSSNIDTKLRLRKPLATIPQHPFTFGLPSITMAFRSAPYKPERVSLIQAKTKVTANGLKRGHGCKSDETHPFSY